MSVSDFTYLPTYLLKAAGARVAIASKYMSETCSTSGVKTFRYMYQERFENLAHTIGKS